MCPSIIIGQACGQLHSAFDHQQQLLDDNADGIQNFPGYLRRSGLLTDIRQTQSWMQVFPEDKLIDAKMDLSFG